MTHLSHKAAISFFFFIILHSYETSADGFRNPFQSASAIAQRNAFAAQADDPSALHYNPAGIVQLPGVQFSGGFQFVSPKTRYDNAAGASTESTLNNLIGFPPTGQLFLTANLSDTGLSWFKDLSAGLAVESLYGF